MPGKGPCVTDAIAVILGDSVARTGSQFQSKVDITELILTKVA